MRSKLVIALALALGSLACEQLLGLDHFQECDAIPCADAAGDAGQIDATDGASSDAFTLPDGVSEASSWARWRMDNRPFEVNNGAPDASLPTFDAGSTNEILDDVSGLIWSTLIGKADNVTSAATYCDGLGFRLPTRIEIVTLLDSTASGAPFVAPPFASALETAQVTTVWTSSYVRPITSTLQFWFADFSTGDMHPSSASNVGVLCVR